MYSFDLQNVLSFPFGLELIDPRGGRVPDTDVSVQINNLHVPYRSPSEVNFTASGLDPQGRVLSVMNFFPGTDSEVAALSGIGAFKSLATKEKTANGAAALYPWPGLDYGVSL